MDIEDIKQSISQMSTEELLEVVRGKRSARLALQAQNATKKAAPKKSSVPRDRLGEMASLLNSLDPTQREEIMRQLKGEE